MPHSVGAGIRRRTDEELPALYPDEEAVLGPNAIQRRRVFFALGRAAARDALTDLGMAPAGIGRGAGGEPQWPAGIVGAITHAGDIAIAVVGRQTDYAGIGVDVEEFSRGPSARAARLVCRPAEMDWVDVDTDTRRLTMLFSAKEAIFKAVYPIEQVWLGFSDAELTWQPERCGFEARLLKRAGAAYPIGAVLQVQCTLTDTQVLSTTYA